MMMHLRYVVGITLVAVLSFASPAFAQETMKHSGSVVSVNESSGTLVVAEVGPWRLREGKTVLTPLKITVTPQTDFSMVSRAAPEVPGTVGPFVETHIAAWAVYPGDFVTIDCRHEGKKLIATKITVTDIPVP